MISPKPWFCAAKGKRDTMEDIHIISAKPHWFLFAVCDGHGGDDVVRYFETHLESFLHQHLNSITHVQDENLINTAITDMCIQLDRNLHSALQTQAQNCGSTLTFVAINRVQNKLIQVNVGDSRSVVLKEGKERMSETTDHKPTSKSEMDRIQKAGGKVVHHRVNGKLALSRAFGDFSFKKTQTSLFDCISGPVCVIPEVKHSSLSLNHAYQIIVACDGIWDTMNSLESLKIAFSYHKHNNPAQAVVLESYKRGSSDNMTCLVISIR